MKKTKINTLIGNYNGKTTTLLVDSWETKVNGLFITKMPDSKKYSFTHKNSGLSFFIKSMKTLKFANFLAKEYFSEIDFTTNKDDFLCYETNRLKEIANRLESIHSDRIYRGL